MTENSHLHDRVVVITGGAGGFGRRLATGAAERGAKVVVADVSTEAIGKVVGRIQSNDGRAIGVETDVTDLAAVRSLVDAAVQEFGAVDVMVNNAGIMPNAFFADHAQAAEPWDRCIDINLKGVLHGIIATHDQMISQRRGHIVNLSSIYSNHPVVGAGVYAATKAAVNVLGEVLRLESQGRIKVTTVRPTGVGNTGLSAGVINPAVVVGILGANLDEYMPVARGEGAPEQYDRHEIANATLDASDLVDQILYAIDQPWGISISDITVRASGDRFVI